MQIKITGRCFATLTVLLLAGMANGQTPAGDGRVAARPGQTVLPGAPTQAPFRSVAERRRSPSEYIVPPAANGGVAEHPLMPALRWAKEGFADIQNLQDYECTFVKRERIDGELTEHEYIQLKVRHQPFSVYMGFLAPAKMKGQEALWVDGQNNGKLWGHPNGLRQK